MEKWKVVKNLLGKQCRLMITSVCSHSVWTYKDDILLKTGSPEGARISVRSDKSGGEPIGSTILDFYSKARESDKNHTFAQTEIVITLFDI